MVTSDTAEPSRTSPAIHVMSAAGVMAMRRALGRRLLSTGIRDTPTSPAGGKPSVNSVGQSANADATLAGPTTP
jgi:hypothetical protein